jgi:thiol:disulfide interchange protein
VNASYRKGKTTVKRFLRVLTILVLGSFSVLAQGNGGATAESVSAPKFDPARDAAKDIELGIARAKQSGRRVLLDVGGEWCIWCKRLDQLFEEKKDLAEFLHRNYVAVKVNYSKENKNEAVLSRYPKVAGYPHLFVLENDGTLLHSQDTGKLEKGKGHDPEKVMAFLKAWAPPH